MEYQTLKGLSPDYIAQLKKRFLAKVNKDNPNDCWEWVGAITSRGYGSLGIWGRATSAHRISHELFNGPIGNHLHVCHRCDNRACVNPAHLFLGTNRDNMQDAKSKGRLHYQTHPRFRQLRIKFKRTIDIKLFPIVKAKYNSGLTGLQIAEELNIGKSSVYRIINDIQRRAGDG